MIGGDVGNRFIRAFLDSFWIRGVECEMTPLHRGESVTNFAVAAERSDGTKIRRIGIPLGDAPFDFLPIGALGITLDDMRADIFPELKDHRFEPDVIDVSRKCCSDDRGFTEDEPFLGHAQE